MKLLQQRADALAFLHRQLGARSPLFSRLMNGTAWSGISGVLNQGGTFVSSIVVARVLGQDAFGQHAILLNLLTSVAVLAQTGLGTSATKHIAEFRSVDKAKTGRILGLCGILCPILAVLFALVVAGTSRFVAQRVLGSEALTGALTVGAVFILFSSVNGYQSAALTGLERYRALVTPAVVSTIVTVGCVAAGALRGGVTGAIVGLSVATALRCYLHYRALKAESLAAGIEISYAGSWSELSLLYRFAVPATLSGYVAMPTIWFASALLVQQPGGYKQMANYAAAQTIRLVVMFVPLLINTVGLSILNNVRRGASPGTYASVRRMNLITLVGVTAVMALLVGCFGRTLLHLFGKDFADSGDMILALLLISAVVEGAMLGFFQSIQAAARMWTALIAIIIPWHAVFVTAAFLLIPRFGATGLAAAFLAGHCMALIATALIARHIGRQPCQTIAPHMPSLPQRAITARL